MSSQLNVAGSWPTALAFAWRCFALSVRIGLAVLVLAACGSVSRGPATQTGQARVPTLSMDAGTARAAKPSDRPDRQQPTVVDVANRGAQAPGCGRFRDCASCAPQLDCQWCIGSQRCIGLADRSCGGRAANMLSQCPGGGGASECGTLRACGTCAAQSNCTWCQDTRRCMDDTDDSCPAGAAAQTESDCPVQECDRHHDCLSCTNDRHCGWCGGPGGASRCVFSGQMGSCPAWHANFPSECGGPDAGATSSTQPPYTYMENGTLFCVPGSPDSNIVCQCPSFSMWHGSTGGLGFGQGGVLKIA